jgi:hypothetical protein
MHRDRYLEEWTHEEKLAGISGQKSQAGAGRWVRGQKSEAERFDVWPSTLIPYDAGTASEGTRDRYQRMVSRRHITAPGQRCP